MNKLLLLSGVMLLGGIGCQKNNTQLLDRLAKVEQRVEVVEKRVASVPNQQQQQAQAEQTQPFDMPTGRSYIMGKKDAPLKLVYFSDFQCPFCEKAHQTFVEKIVEDKELSDVGIEISFKNFPLSFHQNAKAAAKAALAAGEQGNKCFFEMAKKLYAGRGELSEVNYKKWASEITCVEKNGKSDEKLGKLDEGKFLSDLANKDAEFEKMIKEDIELGMKNNAVRGTPAFFLNGWRINQRTVEALKQLAIEKKLVAGFGGKGSPTPPKPNS